MQLVEREAANKELEMKLEMEAGSDAIWSDPYRLRQVLINLLTNAIHATPSGGAITINIQGAEGGVAVSVRDTGEGIPGENLERIFEPFFSTKTPGEGTGLGLFVTRGIVEKLGGSIQLESRLGRGTGFLINLPKVIQLKEDPSGDERVRILDRIIENR
jgi:two-component system, NtrC family, sensor kinase